jgi:hypothetical protein
MQTVTIDLNEIKKETVKEFLKPLSKFLSDNFETKTIIIIDSETVDVFSSDNVKNTKLKPCD